MQYLNTHSMGNHLLVDPLYLESEERLLVAAAGLVPGAGLHGPRPRLRPPRPDHDAVDRRAGVPQPLGAHPHQRAVPAGGLGRRHAAADDRLLRRALQRRAIAHVVRLLPRLLRTSPGRQQAAPPARPARARASRESASVRRGIPPVHRNARPPRSGLPPVASRPWPAPRISGFRRRARSAARRCPRPPASPGSSGRSRRTAPPILRRSALQGDSAPRNALA